MLKKTLSSLSYGFIKYYREKFIKPNLEWDNRVCLDTEMVYNIICDAIESDKPIMISRYGNNELDATLNYRKGHPLSFLRTSFPFWIGEQTKIRMATNAGFFPNDNRHLSRFADLMVDISKEIDILGVMTGFEFDMPEVKNSIKVKIDLLEPFWSMKPWTALLRGKKVLVVHPFEDSIRSQYNRRELLFEDKDTLPEFASLSIVKAVQSTGGNYYGYDTWFDALQYLEEQIDFVDYDIALIGCGSYGMPLAAYCKSQGKKAIHLGGVLQLLFGIRGKRWEYEGWPHKKMINDYWVRPLDSERPLDADKIEEACYW